MLSRITKCTILKSDVPTEHNASLLGVIVRLFAPSHAFIIFFKVFFTVISLGVFHGLVFVPLFVQFVLDLKEAMLNS